MLISTYLNKIDSEYVRRYVCCFIEDMLDEYVDFDVSKDDVKSIVASELDIINYGNMSEYENFLKNLCSLNSDFIAFLYQEYRNKLVFIAKEIKNNIENIFKNMPA